MKRAQFAKEYAERSGVSVKWLKEHGREPIPCDCGELECRGWQMAYIAQYVSARVLTAPDV